MVFRLDEGVETVKVKNSREGFELLLKGITLGDLGAPLGEEETWKSQFRGAGDARVEHIRFDEVVEGVRVRGSWVFSKGGSAPAHPEMEWFDYREKSPPRFVIDLWPKKGPTVAEARASVKRTAHLAVIRKAETEARERAERKLAEAKRRAEVEDVTRFCREPLATQTDVFLPFLPVHEKVDFSHWFSATTPDSRFPYYEPKGKALDAQYVRLALDLYHQGKPALVIRTLDFFDAEHPSSDFHHEMSFLRANALVKLGMPEEAERLLGRLMVDARDTPEALFSGVYLASKLLEKGNHLAALENFLWLIDHHPEHRLGWVFHLGAAECLFALKQTERASKEYEWVVENAPERAAKAQAALRMGDLYSDRFRHDQALAEYSRALSSFADDAKDFPSVHVNRAEALYGLEDYPRAREAYQQFLEKFPAHPAGWRATFRLGEIFGREPGGREEARRWFYETVNRYPFSPGATLARLRLLPCDDHGGFVYDAAERFFSEEAARFDGKNEVSVGLYKELRGLAHVRALITYGHEDSAVGVAISELQATHRPEARHILGGLLGILYRKTVLVLLDRGEKVQALAFYHDKSEQIPREDAPPEADFVLRLSRAAAELGLGSEATGLAETYAKLMSRKGMRMPAAPGGEEDLDVALRTSEQAYTESRALWVGGPGEDAEKQIRAKLALVREESPFSYERELMLGLLDERANKPASALGHALRAQLLRTVTGRAVSDDPRVDAWAARLQASAGEPTAALELYSEVDKKLKLAEARESEPAAARAPARALEADPAAALGVPPAPGGDELLVAEAQLLEKLGRWGDAAETYSRASGGRAAYGYARALLRAGDAGSREKAWGALQKLAAEPAAAPSAAPSPVAASAADADAAFWRKMAREALEDEKSRRAASGPASSMGSAKL
jgi:tetratricopeptide (TPR) repeat protein